MTAGHLPHRSVRGKLIGGVLRAGCLAALLAPSGCGDAASKHAAARLEGAVRIGGQPVQKGFVQFMAQGKGQAPPVSAEISDGRYRADDVPLGPVRAIISATRKTGRMIEEYSQPYEEEVSIVPPKYQAGIPLNVTGDNLTQDFLLDAR